MGVVKIDINKNFYIWNNINLSDYNTIKGLLKYRHKFDILYYQQSLGDNYIDYAEYAEDARFIYIELDDIIKDLVKFDKLNEMHLKILELYQDDYTSKEISEIVNMTPRNVDLNIDNICKKIMNENNWRYLKIKYLHDIGLKSKTCSSCGAELPATEEFFPPFEMTKDRFFSICRKCKQQREITKNKKKNIKI